MLVLAGCGTPAKQAARNKTAPPGVQTGQQADTLPGEVRGRGWHIPWTTHDPKHPNAPPIPVLIADAEEGALSNQKNNAFATLRQVRVKLYQSGRYAADIAAPQITANRRDGVIVGTGGVVLTSVGRETQTTITANKATWNTHTTRVVATGNAHAVRRDRTGAIVGESRSDRMIYNTANDTLTLE